MRPMIALLALVAFLSARCVSAQTAGVPVHIRLEKPGYVTLVIEDAQGRRIRNLISETLLPAGDNTVMWDGYDEGVRADGEGDVWEHDLVRHRVPPGVYT